MASNIGICLWDTHGGELGLSSPLLAFLGVLFHIVASFLSTVEVLFLLRSHAAAGETKSSRARDLRVWIESNQENRQFKRACAL